MSQKARNLLFDLGNVIIDLDIDLTFQNLAKLLRKDADKALIDKAILDYECGRISTDLFINKILSQSHYKAQALDVIEAWNSMLIRIPSYRLEMLSVLRNNFNVYLLSNTNELHLEWVRRYMLKTFQIKEFEKEYFHRTYYSHIIGDRKPLPAIFQHVIDDAILNPSLTLYMDDVQENLDAANQLGFSTYLVKPDLDIAEYLKREGYY